MENGVLNNNKEKKEPTLNEEEKTNRMKIYVNLVQINTRHMVHMSCVETRTRFTKNFLVKISYGNTS